MLCLNCNYTFDKLPKERTYCDKCAASNKIFQQFKELIGYMTFIEYRYGYKFTLEEQSIKIRFNNREVDLILNGVIIATISKRNLLYNEVLNLCTMLKSKMNKIDHNERIRLANEGADIFDNLYNSIKRNLVDVDHHRPKSQFERMLRTNNWAD